MKFFDECSELKPSKAKKRKVEFVRKVFLFVGLLRSILELLQMMCLLENCGHNSQETWFLIFEY